MTQSFEDRARAEAEQAYRGPRMFVGTTVDREIAAFMTYTPSVRFRGGKVVRCSRCGRFTDDYWLEQRLIWSLSDNPDLEETIVCHVCDQKEAE